MVQTRGENTPLCGVLKRYTLMKMSTWMNLNTFDDILFVWTGMLYLLVLKVEEENYLKIMEIITHLKKLL